MAWLTSHWRWTVLNLGAVSALILVLSWGSTDWNTADTPDPGLESGKWAIRFLLLCLVITPLQTYFGWRSLGSLCKSAGLWTFGFAGLHALVYLSQAGWAWLTWPFQPYLALGLLGLLILTVLALTSNRWAMRRLKQQWKRLHRLVYLAGSAGMVHAILATEMSKKILARDPQAIYELNFYLAELVVLLVVRIPVVKRLPFWRPPVAGPIQQVASSTIQCPDIGAEYLKTCPKVTPVEDQSPLRKSYKMSIEVTSLPRLKFFRFILFLYRKPTAGRYIKQN